MAKELNHIDIGEHCTSCYRDTSIGSEDKLFVNRIPSEQDATLNLGNASLDITVTGYQCAECRQMPCDKCGNMVLDDYEILEDARMTLLCPACAGLRD